VLTGLAAWRATAARLDAQGLCTEGLSALRAGAYATAAKHFGEFIRRYEAEPEMQAQLPQVYYLLGCAQYNARP
jgi:TolA-binding protein